MQSEEQPVFIGTCPDCGVDLYLINNRVRWHECPYNYRLDYSYNKIMTGLQPTNLLRLVEDILVGTKARPHRTGE